MLEEYINLRKNDLSELKNKNKVMALVEDMRQQLEEFIPAGKHTRHSQTWGDDNGFSHIRSTFMGPGICVPLSDGGLVLGT